MLSTDDGLRTFRRLVADGSVGGPTGAAVVRAMLRLDDPGDMLVVSDATFGEEMDSFPLSMIGQVSEVTSVSPPFHNVLTFTVLEDAFHLAPPEMYFFQCRDTPVRLTFCQLFVQNWCQT